MTPDMPLLRDIHLPAPVSWWPPAVGWWLIVIAGAGLIALTFWWWRRRVALRSAPATIARAELERLQAAWQGNRDAQWLVHEVSVWLRRAGMSLSSRRQAASLTGIQWQKYLNDMAGEQVFAATDTHLIAETAYRGAEPHGSPVDGDRLLMLCTRWLDASLRKARSS
jgi:hypothetical protein